MDFGFHVMWHGVECQNSLLNMVQSLFEFAQSGWSSVCQRTAEIHFMR